jgi:hypothetical protein
MSYVYLLEISNDDTTIYKIGYTKNSTKRRIDSLQTGNPYPIREVCTYHTKYEQKLERSLHNFYSHCRLEGEWFSLSLSDVANFLKTCDKLEKSFDVLQHKNLNFF